MVERMVQRKSSDDWSSRQVILRSIVVLLVLCPLFSCSNQSTASSDPPIEQTLCPVPPELNDGWQVASLGEVGLDSLPIINMLEEIDRWKDPRFNGILIVKNGVLVFEKYYPGHAFDFNVPALTETPMQYGPTTRHFLASQSESVTSLLFGIALEKEFVESVDDRIESYFSPEYAGLFQDGKERITIKHLLTMSSGLPWNESTPGTDDVLSIFREADPIYFILRRPLEAAPGERFHYNSGGTNLLGEIVRRTTGQSLLQFAVANLFTPLGITSYDWKAIRGDHIFASGGLFLTPRDMAKIGQLCLNGGLWNGRVVVAKAWLEESTKSWIYPTELGLGDGYGYQWWLNDLQAKGKSYHTYSAIGWGEQYMFVVPQESMVVLFFGEYYSQAPQRSVQALMIDYVLPSCQ